MNNDDEVIEVKYPMGALPENEDTLDDWLAGVPACDRFDPDCEACQ